MKTKLNKLIKLTAAGLFLIALALNIKVTLDDPFVMLSEQAIAQSTGTDTTGTTGTTGTGTTSTDTTGTGPGPCVDQGETQTSFRDFNSPLGLKCYDANGIECGRELGCEEDMDAPIRPYNQIVGCAPTTCHN